MDEQPFMVIWETTRACQLACRHCRADSIHHRNPGELDTDEAKRLLDELASFAHPRPIVVLTGGDPFERPDLAELTAYGTSLGLHLALSPSATPNVTRERLDEMRAAGATAMSLSLDGARPETHDAFRGFAGTYDRTLASAALINEVGFRLQVNTTVTRATVHELPELYTQLLDLHAHLWSLFFLVPTGRGQQLQALDPDEVEDVFHWMVDIGTHLAVKTTEAQHFRRVCVQRAQAAELGLGVESFRTGPLYDELTARTRELVEGRTLPQRPARPPIDTNAGRGFAFVDHLGFVYPSGFLPQRAGNVRDDSFVQLYREAPIMRALRRPDEFSGKCGVCEFNRVCGGSRSHAYAVTGDPLASDPTCGYLPPRWVAAQAEVVG
ncbi:TIGR04053 family radical SAM/SPASM domain-containing protein [Arsenicicoccus piscis]|nr:TIGR04053 family radical SAM/SPASM domain-containing protein [Arsenicicoccus piscis]MCH8628132.1 TIGR04053 family radical SAM/SPASM domain-containing protein [Arsenicicoccus piscis]